MQDNNGFGDNTNSDSESNDSDSNFKDEDYNDPNIKDDILKPASTRSKIVVNLKYSKEKGKESYKYELDPYDEVRMRLLYENEKLYNAYKSTIDKL